MERTINERLTRLEKTNRLLVVACSILVALPLLAAVMAFQDPDDDIPKVIRAEKFELIKNDVAVGTLEYGFLGASLELNNRTGEPAIGMMAMGPGGGVLMITNGEEGMNVSMSAGPTFAGLVIQKGTNTVAEIGTTAEGGGIGVRNNDGEPVGKLFSKPAGGVFELFGPDGKLQFRAPESSADLKN